MKSAAFWGSMGIGLVVGLAGCQPDEAKVEEPVKAEKPGPKLGPAAPEPPIVPSPIPAMPDPNKPAEKLAEPPMPADNKIIPSKP